MVRMMCMNDWLIDDRSSGNLKSSFGTEWRLITDNVMGGVSRGELGIDIYKDRNCLRMQGDVSTANNGGFVQISLSLADAGEFDASVFAGIVIDVAGNDEHYNIHLRTAELGFPWQSYRFSFMATGDWQSIRIPFVDFVNYKTELPFRADKLKRIGLVAIGRDFKADLYLASLRFYRMID